MNELKGILHKGYCIEDHYSVLLFIKRSSNAETYRLIGKGGKIFFLKLFLHEDTPPSSYSKDNTLLEIDILKSLKNPHITSFVSCGELFVINMRFTYLILDFIPGETLIETISRERISSIYDIKQYTLGVLRGVENLHTQSIPIIHNEISLHNVMLDLSNSHPTPILIDFGHARYINQSAGRYSKEGLNINYIAPECFNGQFSPLSDIYSIGVFMYHLLYGIPPWFRSVSTNIRSYDQIEESIIEERRTALQFPDITNRFFDFDKGILKIIAKALSFKASDRFTSVKELIDVLEGKTILEVESSLCGLEPVLDPDTNTSNSIDKGKGFDAIAGMQHLKSQLQNDVIDILESPEEYAKHNLSMPNGMLLYGPPGCGKTFFAEKFAEETGYHFKKVVASDIASIYVHGTQEKIASVFNDARENAPCILFFDELDAMVPNRDKVNNQSQSGEVNEFLSQLDNIGKQDVFVIGSTNKPESIDPAVLRAGRLEKWFFIPPPDYEARVSMFKLYLKDRPIDVIIDYNRLASLTKNYVSSDIKLLIDESSRKTIKDKLKRITMATLESIIESQSPTVPLTVLREYDEIRKRIEGI